MVLNRSLICLTTYCLNSGDYLIFDFNKEIHFIQNKNLEVNDNNILYIQNI